MYRNFRLRTSTVRARGPKVTAKPWLRQLHTQPILSHDLQPFICPERWIYKPKKDKLFELGTPSCGKKVTTESLSLKYASPNQPNIDRVANDTTCEQRNFQHEQEMREHTEKLGNIPCVHHKARERVPNPEITRTVVLHQRLSGSSKSSVNT